MVSALDGVTVLDLTHYIAGPYATKMLADYGADVIKVERPGGDPARRLGPFQGGTPDPERSGAFFYLNINKRSIVLDLTTAGGRDAFGRLLDRVDVVVESFRPGVLDRLGFGWEFIHSRRPGVPLVSISNFGQTGPYRDYKGSELTLFGFAGELYSMGLTEREPVTVHGVTPLIESGSAAAAAILAALMIGRDQGRGEHVDFAIADSHLCGADRRPGSTIAFEFAGRKTLRQPGNAWGAGLGVYPCADGYVEFTGAHRFLDRMADMMGDPEWLRDPKWRQPGVLIDPANAEEFNTGFYTWLLQHTRHEVWAEARRARVICGPLFTVEDLFSDPHFRERGFWQEVSHPVMGTFEMPGRPFILGDAPWAVRRPAPLLGEHTAEVLTEAGLSADQIRALTADATTGVR